MLKQKLFIYIKDVIDKKRRNIFLSALLTFLSLFFRFLSFFRNALYDLKILKATKVKSKVISIGNIVAGGAGKTPFTIFLAKKLISKYKVGIISRGYKSKAENKNIVIDQNTKFLAKDISDEALVLKNHINDALFFIGKDKLKSCSKATQMKCDVSIIDDGFQYRKLKKDIEIVIINAKDPFGKNSFLPKGYLREHPKNLKRADFIVINNANGKINHLENQIKQYSSAPIAYTKPYVKRVLDTSKKEIKIRKKSKIAAFCAIANPDIFFENLKDLGFEIVNTIYLLDHETVHLKSFKTFIESSIAKGAKYILTTEKDIVKFPNVISSDIPILYLEIDLKITHNHEHLSRLVEKI
ncbi:MAG: Tetraacyldisaccharide 4'-kinase [Candidatus Anoxychlamydiales bacterium]|nr:Tetraacyldisaccharide 4'-kinase [Candidatus Anoxychlamydiales bacterium]